MVRMPAGHLPSPPMEAARLFPEPAAGEPYTILIMVQPTMIFGTDLTMAEQNQDYKKATNAYKTMEVLIGKWELIPAVLGDGVSPGAIDEAVRAGK
jgi:hypothetical protein